MKFNLKLALYIQMRFSKYVIITISVLPKGRSFTASGEA